MAALLILDLVRVTEDTDARGSRSTMPATSPPMQKAGAIAATGWPSTTTCRASPAPRPRSSIGHMAGGTSTIRVGAGGIMLPNHAPLVIAEQFGTLESLYPGRIDLGLGRAPGSDQLTARALRRDLGGGGQLPAGRPGAAELLPPVPPGQPSRRSPAAGRRCRSGSSGRATSAPGSPPSSGSPRVRLPFRPGPPARRARIYALLPCRPRARRAVRDGRR